MINLYLNKSLAVRSPLYGVSQTLGFFYLGGYYMKTAILVDGGYYRKKAYSAFGDLAPKERADELYSYCKRHLIEKKNHIETFDHELYRIFYYDCSPSSKKIYHPILDRTIDLSKSNIYDWTINFFEELSRKRKVALRLGMLSDNNAHYNLKADITKRIVKGAIKVSDLTEADFAIQIDQKGVDMKIGLDIASLSYKHQVEQIVLIAGDSDFVPAAKLARREGIDFILDPLGANIKKELSIHIDGLRTCDNAFKHRNTN